MPKSQNILYARARVCARVWMWKGTQEMADLKVNAQTQKKKNNEIHHMSGYFIFPCTVFCT